MRTLDWYPSPPKPPPSNIQQPTVIPTNRRYDIHSRLHRQMECPLFKRPQFRAPRIAPRALREDEYALPGAVHLLRRILKRLDRPSLVCSVDKHRPTECHEPAQKGYLFEAGFGRHGAVRRENRAQEQDVEFALVVADDDARPCAQIFFALDDFEAHARRSPHGVFEATSDKVLGDTMISKRAQDDGDKDAIGSAEDKGGVGREAASVEGGEAKAEVGKREEGCCYRSVGNRYAE